MPARGHLFQKLCQPETLRQAWRGVIGHYPRERVPEDLAGYEKRLDRNLESLAEELARQRFIPEPAALIFKAKTSNPQEKRKISLIRPEDRIVLTALQRLLDPVFEPRFPSNSYAYRRGRGPLDAIRRVELCLNQSLEFAAAFDIDDFFDSIDRKLLLEVIRRYVWEPPLLRLLGTGSADPSPGDRQAAARIRKEARPDGRDRRHAARRVPGKERGAPGHPS